ncbi:Tho complex subunit 7-domain-containing protein [Cubamyces lactineus]|nr:Tho complex subunit 7-domain-containing protein [Cubamyces lactineus]
MASSTDASATRNAAEKEYVPPPLSVQQEDAIIHTRITNDEKALRRVTRKFHNYASVAYPSLIPPTPSNTTSVDDARDAFLLELAAFQLSLKKSLMVCEAEARQVEEYQRERERIVNERSRLRDQIEELKATLEQAQLERKQKIEYDVVAEKINTLPSRTELERSIQALENDMAAIRAEHENQNRVLHAQKAALDTVIHDINVLRLMGKDAAEESTAATPAPETQPGEDVDMDGTASVRTREESGELREDAISRATSTAAKLVEDTHESDEDIPLSKALLNPAARSFMPKSRTNTPGLPTSRSTSTIPSKPTVEDDIEMGEIGEEPKDARGRRKTRVEELEEGEASDESSELSEPPDD